MQNFQHRITRVSWLLVLAFAAGSAQAATVTDGSLSVNVSSDGQFNIVELNSEPIDTSGFVQQ